jgi:hypothetical protein
MRTPLGYLRGVRHPEAYHGHGTTNHFFEGWYIKLVNQALTQRWAVIPGIFKGPRGSQEASISNTATTPTSLSFSC